MRTKASSACAVMQYTLDIHTGQNKGNPPRGTAYVYDGSIEGLYSAVFAATLAHDPSADVLREGDLQPRLGQDVIPVETNLSHAERVRRTLIRAHGPSSDRTISLAALSDNPGIPLLAYRFISYAIEQDNPCAQCESRRTCHRPCMIPPDSGIMEDIGNPLVWQLDKTARAVMAERHRWQQFLRFEHLEGDVWYARCNPSASIVPLLMGWFTARFNTQRFIIYDEVHGISGIRDGTRTYLVRGDAPTLPQRAAEEAGMQDAWRRFWKSLSIEERYNPELQRSQMPKRIWRNLTEMNGQPDASATHAEDAVSIDPEPAGLAPRTREALPSHRKAG